MDKIIKKIHDKDLGLTLEEIKILKRLDISDIILDDKGYKIIAKLLLKTKNLKMLFVDFSGDDSDDSDDSDDVDSNIEIKNIRLLFKNLPTSLESLHIRNGINDEGIKVLTKTLPKLINLERLSIRSYCKKNNNISYIGSRALAKTLPSSLKTIHINHNNIGDKGLRAFSKNLPKNLELLELSYNNIGDEGLRALSKTISTTNIRKLKLDNNNIGNKGITALSKTLSTTNIRELKLDYNNIGDKGLRAFSKNLPKNLELLNLDNNNITDKGIIDLSKTLSTTNIRELNIRNNIGDKGAYALYENLPKNLELLNMHFNRIDDEFIQKELRIIGHEEDEYVYCDDSGYLV